MSWPHRDEQRDIKKKQTKKQLHAIGISSFLTFHFITKQQSSFAIFVEDASCFIFEWKLKPVNNLLNFSHRNGLLDLDADCVVNNQLTDKN